LTSSDDQQDLKTHNIPKKTLKQAGVSHCGLAISIKKYLKAKAKKKNYENSNISPCENIIFKKNSKTK